MTQDPKEVADLVRALEYSKGGKRKGDGKKGVSVKSTNFPVAGSDGISVDSWRYQDWDYKRDDLPTYARGLFTTKRKDGTQEIAIRGYDKFFNVGEVPSTEWANVEADTTGPYELSVKENGCIIFMSGLEDGTLLVCSKHSTGARHDVEESHAVVGEKWVKKHLENTGRTTKDLARALRSMNATAVAELCDDDFEEHVLEYPPEMAGLYLHGINFNLPGFSTLSGAEVHKFADAWGFKKAKYLTIQSIADVRYFLDTCAETGSWDGRDTEGFVVRCKQRLGGTIQTADWFFKYKFEEPYLMYRQWREATKAVISGRPPKYKKHKKITEEYLLFARRQLAKDPKLGKLYNQNHGIIKMRDDFLAYKGQKGSDIIRQEKDDGEDTGDVVSNIVLVPIATIGCGKTTVATALAKLFDFGHIQNDNIEGQKGRPLRFAMHVINLMAAHKLVIADRNNHVKRERAQIIDDVTKVVPNARFVAMQYVHEPKSQMLDGIRQITRERVLNRGDNHQTIRAGSKSQDEIIGIMEGFLGRFQGCDSGHEPDSNFELVINLDVAASSLDNLENVITQLYNMYPKLFPSAMPSREDMEDAIDFGMNHLVETKHDLSFGKPQQQGRKDRGSRQQTPQNTAAIESRPLTPNQLLGRLEYFAVTVPGNDIINLLASVFAKTSPEEARMYNQLRQTRRIQTEFHVTMIHRASSRDNPEVWQQYTDAYLKAMSHVDTRDQGKLLPALGNVQVMLERLVWDERVVAFVVRVIPASEGPAWPSANDIAHITVGTASQDIKPKESNDLLQRWEEGSGAGSKIWEKAISGKMVEGKVKPVFQRGRGPVS
jgi:tRNA ligase